jgi:hypothetical protein
VQSHNCRRIPLHLFIECDGPEQTGISVCAKRKVLVSLHESQ